MSLDIEKMEENGHVFSLHGRLDTTTAPTLEAALGDTLSGGSAVTLDMAELEYISSAGLRVLLTAYKALGDGLRLVNVGESIMEVLEMTGFTDFLSIG